jgi:N-carbamoylputrescine amidase
MTIRISVAELPDNRDRFELAWPAFVQHVDFAESDIVVLPELIASSWFASDSTFDQAVWDRVVADHERLVSTLGQFGNAIVIGSRAVESNGLRRNVAFIWSKETGLIDRHAKSLLPEEKGYYEQSWYHESDDVQEPIVVRGISIGVMICSELMWTEKARLLGTNGAQIIAVPRATEASALWKAGSQMAAITSGAFVATSNRNGQADGDPKSEFGGTSMIIDPNGNMLAETSKEKPCASAAIDPRDAVTAKTYYPRDLHYR